MRNWASFVLLYFTPKSSTFSVNASGLCLCFPSPGTFGRVKKACLYNMIWRLLYAMCPDCGRPYMPILTFM